MPATATALKAAAPAAGSLADKRDTPSSTILVFSMAYGLIGRPSRTESPLRTRRQSTLSGPSLAHWHMNLAGLSDHVKAPPGSGRLRCSLRSSDQGAAWSPQIARAKTNGSIEHFAIEESSKTTSALRDYALRGVEAEKAKPSPPKHQKNVDSRDPPPTAWLNRASAEDEQQKPRPKRIKVPAAQEIDHRCAPVCRRARPRQGASALKIE
jgi:hypothetical protein